MIRELDVRFPPNATISEEDREARVLLLASDVADMIEDQLEAAVREWIRTKAFMPKASELRSLAGDLRQKALSDPDDLAAIGRRVAENYNTRLQGEGKALRWVYNEKADTMHLVPLDEFRRRDEPRCTPDEARDIRDRNRRAA
ncbi:hypothetical protein MRBLMC3_000801 [Sphingobium sp. LMC3-1-1.1]|uniref:hypothetical protein n=1 Tax=Sphingobium sp. LMC3-1-1.1 TaxID=3135241 RepID=UPI003432C696